MKPTPTVEAVEEIKKIVGGTIRDQGCKTCEHRMECWVGVQELGIDPEEFFREEE